METSSSPGPHPPVLPAAGSPTMDNGPQQRQRRATWTQHSGVYRSIDDPSKAWVPSPHVHPSSPPTGGNAQQKVSPDFLLDLKFRRPSLGVEVQSLGSSEESSLSSGRELPQLLSVVSPPHPHGSEPPRKRKSTVRRLAGKIRSLGLSVRKDSVSANPIPEQHAIPKVASNTSSVVRKSSTKVQPHEWKEWGYYARPLVNGVYVHNSHYQLQHMQDSGMTVEEVFRSLTSPTGVPHPERWKLGITHPSLPPRPTRWSPPDPTKPLPFPWEVQLNPLLEHILFGVPRLNWDIKDDISAAQLALTPLDDGIREAGIRESTCLLSEPDFAQPATYPFLTHMYVNALADDILPKFAWPFMVLNPHGIKIRDIINSIYFNFQEYVREREFYGWTVARRREAARTHRKRCDPQEHPFKATAGEVDVDDDMRRIDYLGIRTLFRGLAPNPDMTGWVLYLGQD